MVIHKLKIEERYFESYVDKEKSFEIRKNDRDFNRGDTVVLSEINEDGDATGRSLNAQISYVSAYAQTNNYVVFNLVQILFNEGEKYDIC